MALRARRALDVPRAETWIHAASVGEASGLPPLLAEWRRRRPHESVALSAMTPGGRAALARLGHLAVTAPPYDAPGPARRAVLASGLRRLVLLETEIWPAWIEAALSANARVAFVNARLSDRSWPMYRRIARSLAPLLARVTAVAAQTEIDADRWRSLGVPADRVRVTGNTKHEALAAVEPPTAAEKAEAQRRLDLDQGQVWCVWASLRPGEEQWLRKAMPLVPPGTRFLVVPRHPDRWRKAYRPGEGYGEVVWLLSLGVLPEALRACDLAIMGGTLAGGQRSWIETLKRAVRQAIEERQLAADTDPEQIAFEMFGIALVVHHHRRLLGYKKARERALTALDSLFKRQSVS